MNGISGYYYILDQNPATVPTTMTGTYTTNNFFTPAGSLTDGHWYLHIVSNDSLGNVGTEAAHFQVNIDTTGPSTSITVPKANHNSSSSSVGISWTAIDAGIGYQTSSVWLDATTNIYTGPNLSFTVTGLTEGSHLINVTTTDYLTNAQSHWTTIFVDLSNPTVSITSHSNGDSVSPGFILSWMASDGQSGYYYAEVYIDGILETTVQGPSTQAQVSNISAGSHTVAVTVYDWSGRSATDQVTLTSSGLPPLPSIPGFPIEAIALGGIIALSLSMLYRRRKRK